jgi:uncharacterized protein YjiS (DUF1127 family)
MENTMATRPITYQADSDTPAPRGFTAAIGHELVAARCAHALANELRIRRDRRALMAMSDEMLKDIGLTRAEISGAVRYGRE